MNKAVLSPQLQARLERMRRRAARDFLLESAALLAGLALCLNGLVLLVLEVLHPAVFPPCAAAITAALLWLARKNRSMLAAINRRHGLQLHSPGWMGLFSFHHFLAFDPKNRKLAYVHICGDCALYDFADIESWQLDIPAHARSTALRRCITRLPFLPRPVLLQLRGCLLNQLTNRRISILACANQTHVSATLGLAVMVHDESA